MYDVRPIDPERRAALTTGTVTRFTDIAGRAQRCDGVHRYAMPGTVRRNDAPARAAIEARGRYVLQAIGQSLTLE